MHVFRFHTLDLDLQSCQTERYCWSFVAKDGGFRLVFCAFPIKQGALSRDTTAHRGCCQLKITKTTAFLGISGGVACFNVSWFSGWYQNSGNYWIDTASSSKLCNFLSELSRSKDREGFLLAKWQRRP